MKALLTSLVVILLGLVFWVRHVSVRPTEAHREIIAGLKEELEESEIERDKLVTELAQLKAALKQPHASTQHDGGGFTELPSSAPAALPASDSGSASTTLEKRLQELSDIYHRNHAGILKRKAGFEAALDAGRAKREAILAAPMTFSEQTTITDIEGNVTGMRGVRTSNADRERALAKRNDTIKEIDIEIKSMLAQIAGTEAEIKRLDELYQNAIAKAKAEFGSR